MWGCRAEWEAWRRQFYSQNELKTQKVASVTNWFHYMTHTSFQSLTAAALCPHPLVEYWIFQSLLRERRYFPKEVKATERHIQDLSDVSRSHQLLCWTKCQRHLTVQLWDLWPVLFLHRSHVNRCVLSVTPFHRRLQNIQHSIFCRCADILQR